MLLTLTDKAKPSPSLFQVPAQIYLKPKANFFISHSLKLLIR